MDSGIGSPNFKTKEDKKGFQMNIEFLYGLSFKFKEDLLLLKSELETIKQNSIEYDGLVHQMNMEMKDFEAEKRKIKKHNSKATHSILGN